MKRIILAAALLTLSGAAAYAQQGYWVQDGSIYGNNRAPQWRDTGNSGNLSDVSRQQLQRFNATPGYGR